MSARRWLAVNVRTLVRSPMAGILGLIFAIRVVGIGWGLPASDGWDTDGIAPRDFLPGLAATFTPGKFFTYPPLHLALLAVLTLPIVVVAVLRAPSTSLPAIIDEILKVPYMTSIAYVARATSLVMSLGIVLFAGRIAEEIRARELGLAPSEAKPSRTSWLDGDWEDPRVRRAGRWSAVVVGVNATLTYYAHTTNLDVPYLFWAMWALWTFARAIARRQPRLLRRAFVLAVFAIGTKDQAYAMFLVALPIAFLLWLFLDGWARGRRAAISKEAGKAVALASVVFVVVDAVVFNPTGFKARLAFLTGSASKDFGEYTANWSGRKQILLDAWQTFDLQYPVLVAPLFVVGLVVVIGSTLRAPAERRGGQLALGLLPALVAISFTVAFNWASLRTNARFLLPQALMLGIYAGRTLDLLFDAPRPPVRWAARALMAVPLGLAVHRCISVDVNLLFDPRYEAEAWLRAHVRPGETVETYGLNVYLPHFPPEARVIRVGPEPVAKRNPLPPLEEVEAPFDAAPSREARWIVLSVGWGWRYLIQPHPELPSGHALPPNHFRTASDEAATRWFERLITSSDAFRIEHESKYELARWFPLVDVHGASGRPIWIYVRK